MMYVFSLFLLDQLEVNQFGDMSRLGVLMMCLLLSLLLEGALTSSVHLPLDGICSEEEPQPVSAA